MPFTRADSTERFMMHRAAHRDCVDAWMLRAGAAELPPEELVQTFDEAAAALWQRALVTLGEVTLAAMLDRVLCTAAEQFPFLASVEVHATGLGCGALREGANALPRDPLLAAIRFVLVEILTVIGSLTAEILSPALHAALSRVPSGAGRTVEDGPADHLEQASRESGQAS